MYFRLIKLVGSDECVCIIWGVRNIKLSTGQVYNAMYHVQAVLYNDKVSLALTHHTEFVQTMSKEVDSAVQRPWTGL